MKKLLTLALCATGVATSPLALASNQISALSYTKFNSAAIEVHFDTPDNATDVCSVQLRQASYPNTVWLTQDSRNEAGSPSSNRQWVDFEVPRTIRGNTKQIRVVCPTANGAVQKVVRLPAPPTVTFTLTGVKNSDYTVTVKGGAYVEGNAKGTYCTALHTNAIVDRPLFTDDLGAVGGYYSSFIQVEDTVDMLHHGYGQARFECVGEGGTTLEMLEMRDEGEQGISFSQSTLTWY